MNHTIYDQVDFGTTLIQIMMSSTEALARTISLARSQFELKMNILSIKQTLWRFVMRLTVAEDDRYKSFKMLRRASLSLGAETLERPSISPRIVL